MKFFLALLAVASAELLNVKVNRKVSLQQHYLKVETSVTIKNTGDNPKSRVKLLPDPTLQSKLSSFLVYQNGASVWIDPESWEAQLSEPVAAGQTVDLKLEEVYTHVFVPLPESIKQTADQLMVYEGSLHHYSPYKIRREQISFTFPAKKIISHFPTVGAKKAGKAINFPDFKDLAANQDELFKTHYEANIQFLSTHYLFREVEVSHWGNVKVENNAEVRHRGAILDGSYSRVQYGHDGGDDASNVHWVPKLTAVLPVDSYDVYYGDQIGNISTSRMRQHHNRVEVEMRPRTPLFGGWKAEFTMRYNLPSEAALFHARSDSSRYTLKLKAIDHLYTNQVVDEVEINVVLPESAINIEIKTPAGYERGHDQLKYTYLDITGRPIIVLRAKNLAGKSLDQMLEVSYTFSAGAIYREPAMTIMFFMTIFLCVMLIVRLDFSIASDGSADVKERIAAAYQRAAEANNSRSAALDGYQLAFNRYKQTKELSLLKEPTATAKDQAESFCTAMKDIVGDCTDTDAQTNLRAAMKQASGLVEQIGKGEAGLAKIKEIDANINKIINRS
jgi:oligosaccharyltransferase complex subunit alpha (ribophorin I)